MQCIKSSIKLPAQNFLPAVSRKLTEAVIDINTYDDFGRYRINGNIYSTKCLFNITQLKPNYNIVLFVIHIFNIL